MLVTYNRRDFQVLDGEWHARGEQHCGIIWMTDAIILRNAIRAQVRALQRMATTFETLDDLIVPLQRPPA